MKLHAKARTCPNCRLLIVEWVLHERRPIHAVARDSRISVRTARKWIKRYRQDGVVRLDDKTSAPHVVPRRFFSQARNSTMQS